MGMTTGENINQANGEHVGWVADEHVCQNTSENDEQVTGKHV